VGVVSVETNGNDAVTMETQNTAKLTTCLTLTLELFIVEVVVLVVVVVANEQLDPRCSAQTCQRPNQLRYAFTLISCPAKGRKLS